MKIDANSLPDDPEQLKNMVLELQHRMDKALAKKDEIIDSLLERFEVAKRKQFGQSSEKLPGSGETFNEAEEIIDEADKVLLAESEINKSNAVKSKPKRKPLPKNLPRKIVTIDLSSEEKICDCCQSKLHQIGETRSEKLAFVPAHIKVIETVRPKYACKQCEKTDTKNHIKLAPMPTSPIPRGIATSSLLSQVISAKYQYGLPLYRQEKMFTDYGIALSRKTMSDWIIRCGELFAPLYEKLKNTLLSQAVIHADESVPRRHVVIPNSISCCF